MISDVLSDAGDRIREYLDEMPDVYRGPMRARIDALLREMASVRMALDAPPSPHAIVERDGMPCDSSSLRISHLTDAQRSAMLRCFVEALAVGGEHVGANVTQIARDFGISTSPFEGGAR